MDNIGIQNKPNKGRDLTVDLNGEIYYRYPVKTNLVNIDDDLDLFLSKFAKPYCSRDDLFCLSAKIVSITKGFYVREENLKISLLAKLLVKFVKKWPDDWGFAVPQKIQLAINIVGLPRFLFAVVVGGFLKILGFKGWFYRLAGNNINGIDGFAPREFNPAFPGYGFIIPNNPDKICNEIQKKHGLNTILTDSNNVDSHIIGVSDSVKNLFEVDELKILVSGNPGGQEDGTPIVIIKNKPLNFKI